MERNQALTSMTTLRELKYELADVDQLLHATWLKEREIARRHIAELAVELQLSPNTVAKDIEAAQRSSAPPLPVLRPPRVDLPLRREGTAQYIETKYRNPTTGDAWTGRGPRPRWLREALEAGSVLEDFLVDAAGSTVVDPLRSFQNAASRAQLTVKV